MDSTVIILIVPVANLPENGGCRGNAWYYEGDFLEKDSKCWLV
ncbi:MAG: hypothetical protein BAJATHORv1_120058 [Candidatus Thorarchaeota archaeon]|nr:MAG: hypothetical protein BAJATHORv1_120058 [Candidatus Thorarchaeota archaeon]